MAPYVFLCNDSKTAQADFTVYASALLTFIYIAAKTAVRLWYMERQTYRTIITNKSKKKREQLMGFLKTWVLRTLLHMRWFLLMSRCHDSVGIFHGFMSHITTISNPAAMFSIRCHRSRTLRDLNDVQLSKIIDSMEEVCKCELWVFEPFSCPTTVFILFE